MAIYWKTAGGILISLVLWITLQRQEKDMALLLSIGVCALAGAVLVSLLEPVTELMAQIEACSASEEGILSRLLPILGIGIAGEMIALLCADAGNAALGKITSLLSTGAMLYGCIPMIRSLLELLQEILGFL